MYIVDIYSCLTMVRRPYNTGVGLTYFLRTWKTAILTAWIQKGGERVVETGQKNATALVCLKCLIIYGWRSRASAIYQRCERKPISDTQWLGEREDKSSRPGLPPLPPISAHSLIRLWCWGWHHSDGNLPSLAVVIGSTWMGFNDLEVPNPV